MDARWRNLLVLASCQALTLAANATVFTVSVMVGQSLAGDKSFATLPMTTSVLGTTLATVPMSFLMRRIGRRAGFTVGALCGVAGTCLGLAALYAHSFLLLCLGMMLFGVQGAAAQYYRFAAAETSDLERRGTAISTVLAGGTPRPLRVVAAQPGFIVAALCAAIGWGVMNLLMVATPLAMSCCHPYSAAASVIQWHVVGMFAPSFFTGTLVRRAGAPTVMFGGVLLQLVCVAIALSGTDVMHFWLALVLLGIGWNFLYVGTTTLLTETYTPAERAKSQGLNELLVSTTLIFSSATSGWLVARDGWAGPNHVAAPLLAVAGIAILWLMARRRAQPMAQAA